ncbi:hypothetical protein [Roseibium sp.]|uniref:hypothetical protein n=1 Tax=Roseibium sp. TaxID=1936156 RepID=UPI003D0BFFDA
MRELKDEIEEARERVAFCRIKAERPSARLEDEFALEKARNRLLTLELRQLKRGGGQTGPGGIAEAGDEATKRRVSRQTSKRTKHEQLPRSARDRAEAAFASLQGGVREKTLGLGQKGNS